MKKRIKLTESDLHRVIKESVKRVLREGYWSGGEHYEDEDEMYIGRTHEYYDSCENDDCVFTPEYWTYSEDPNNSEFAGQVYSLNAEGISELNWWLHTRNMSEYRRRNTFNPSNMSSEEMWEYLTNPENELSTPLN